MAIAPAAFLESALAGTGFCTGFASCTAAVVFKEQGNLTSQSVWSLWSDLDNGGFNFPRSMLNTPINCVTGTEIGCGGQMSSGVGVNASVGHGNYNGAFVSLKATNWHGITLQENFTWSTALGTGALVQATSEYTVNDPFDLHNGYGLQSFDRKFVFNTVALDRGPLVQGSAWHHRTHRRRLVIVADFCHWQRCTLGCGNNSGRRISRPRLRLG